jgi:hypothetical protein
MRKLIDLTGQKFNKLFVIKLEKYIGGGRSTWLCRCDCGNEKIITGYSLKNSNTKSCGCIKKEGNNLRHGCSKIGKKSRTYTTWQLMKARCENKNNKNYKDYGGRGIKICKRWLKFENFLKDIGEIPNGLTLDRINNNKGYFLKNYKLSTKKEQARNKRNSRLFTYKGKTQCISAWAETYNIPYQLLYRRICIDKWSVEKALTTPIKKQVRW